MNANSKGGQYASDASLTTSALQLQLISCVNNLIQSTAEADRQRQELLQSALNGVSTADFTRRIDATDAKLDRMFSALQVLSSTIASDRQQIPRFFEQLEGQVSKRVDLAVQCLDSQLIASKIAAQDGTAKVIEMFDKSHIKYMNSFRAVFDRVNKLQLKLGIDIGSPGDPNGLSSAENLTIADRLIKIERELDGILSSVKGTNNKGKPLERKECVLIFHLVEQFKFLNLPPSQGMSVNLCRLEQAVNLYIQGDARLV